MICEKYGVGRGGGADKKKKKEREGSKKGSDGRAGAAARKAKQKRLLKQLQAAKESLRPPVSASDNDGTSASSSGTGLRIPDRECADTRPEHNHNWIPWIIGACLAGGSFAYVFAGGNMRLHASPTSEAAGPAPKVQDKSPQSKACPDPHYMQ